MSEFNNPMESNLEPNNQPVVNTYQADIVQGVDAVPKKRSKAPKIIAGAVGLVAVGSAAAYFLSPTFKNTVHMTFSSPEVSCLGRA